MALPIIVGSAGTPTLGNVSSISLTNPGGTAVNDYLVAILSVDGSVGTATPSGWTKFFSYTDATNAQTIQIYYKKLTVVDNAAQTFTMATGTETMVGRLYVMRGLHGTTPITQIGVDKFQASGTSFTYPTSTTNQMDTLVFALTSVGVGAKPATGTFPSTGWTADYNDANGAWASNNTMGSFHVAKKDMPIIGALPAGSITISTSSSIYGGVFQFNSATPGLGRAVDGSVVNEGTTLFQSFLYPQSFSSSGSGTTVTLGAWAPNNITGIIVQGTGTSYSTAVKFRKKSTDSAASKSISLNESMFSIIPVDTATKSYYIESGASFTGLSVVGYTTSEVVMLPSAVDIGSYTASVGITSAPTWQTHDISSLLSPGDSAIGVIASLSQTSSGLVYYFARPNGYSAGPAMIYDSGKTLPFNANVGGQIIMPVDGTNKFQTYAGVSGSAPTVNVTIHGYIKSKWTFPSNILDTATNKINPSNLATTDTTFTVSGTTGGFFAIYDDPEAGSSPVVTGNNGGATFPIFNRGQKWFSGVFIGLNGSNQFAAKTNDATNYTDQRIAVGALLSVSSVNLAGYYEFALRGYPAVIDASDYPSPPSKAFTFAKPIPIVSSGGGSLAPLKTLTVTKFTPTVATGKSEAVPLKAFTFTPYAPATVTTKVFYAGLTAFSLNQFAPSVSSGKNIIMPLKTFSFNNLTPFVGVSALVVAPTQVFTLTSFIPHKGTSVALYQFSLNKLVPEVGTGVNVEQPSEAVLTITGIIPEDIGERISTKIFPDTFEFDLVGQAGLAAGKNLQIPVRNFIVTNGILYYKLSTVKFTGEPVPAEHLKDALKLDGDAYVDLFQIILSNKQSILYFTMNKTKDWQGHTYEGNGIKLEGVGNYADDEVSRPKLSLWNPEGIYSYLVDEGLLDSATIVRYRVLKEHIDADLPIYRRQQWKVSRIASLRKGLIGVELRDMLDGQLFMTPGRMFIPPDFPTVSLN